MREQSRNCVGLQFFQSMGFQYFRLKLIIGEMELKHDRDI